MNQYKTVQKEKLNHLLHPYRLTAQQILCWIQSAEEGIHRMSSRCIMDQSRVKDNRQTNPVRYRPLQIHMQSAFTCLHVKWLFFSAARVQFWLDAIPASTNDSYMGHSRNHMHHSSEFSAHIWHCQYRKHCHLITRERDVNNYLTRNNTCVLLLAGNWHWKFKHGLRHVESNNRFYNWLVVTRYLATDSQP